MIGAGLRRVGLFAGVGLAAGIRSLLKLVGAEIPTTSPAIETRTVVAAFAVGLVVTVVAALAPAWSATRVSPMEALRDAVPTSAGDRRGRVDCGRLDAGAVAAPPASWRARTSATCRGGPRLATLAAFAGLVVAGPLLARRDRPGSRTTGRRGGGWRMAARNIARNARRSAATALALTIGLTVVVAVAVTAASMRDSVSAAVAGGNRSDLILAAGGSSGSGISPAVADLLRERDDLADVVEIRECGARVNGARRLRHRRRHRRASSRVIDLGMDHGERRRPRARAPCWSSGKRGRHARRRGRRHGSR